MFHISVSSLRHYEKIGLLIPAYISPVSGYRYYATEQFEILNTIRYLRALDMPLLAIEDFFKNKDISCIEEKLWQQKQIVLQKQQELKRIEQKINHRLSWLQDAQNVPLDAVSLVQLPLCRIVWVENSLKISASLDMEAPIQYKKLLAYIQKHQLQIVGFSREITLIDYGITNDKEKFVTEICIPIKCD